MASGGCRHSLVFHWCSAMNHSCTFPTKRNIWITVNISKRTKQRGEWLHRSPWENFNLNIFWDQISAYQVLRKSHAMPAYIPHAYDFFFLFSPHLGCGPWEIQILTTELWSASWLSAQAGTLAVADKSQRGFWSVFRTYVHKQAHWSPIMAALNPNVKKNLYTNIF